MKKTVPFIIIFSAVFILSANGCAGHHTTDPGEYGSNKYISQTGFFPDSIEEYTVNSYSYNSYDGYYTCTEVFLDITAGEEQLEQIINDANNSEKITSKRQAFYDPDYTEIVFRDDYEMSYEGKEGLNSGNEKARKVGSADIEKIIYNRKTRNIIFEYFIAQAIGKYPFDEVEYFNRFDITEEDYAHRFD